MIFCMIFLLLFSSKEMIYSHHLLHSKIIYNRDVTLDIWQVGERSQIVSELSSFSVLCYDILSRVTFH
jgi:hypothetical protein